MLDGVWFPRTEFQSLARSVKSEERQREISHARTERTMLRVMLGGTIGLVALIAGLWACVHFFSRWQESRLVRHAYAYFDNGDLKAASLTAQHVLESHPDSAPAARLMALMNERLNDSHALDWRRKVSKPSRVRWTIRSR